MATPNLTDAQREAIPNLSTLFNKGQDNKGSAVRNPYCCGRCIDFKNRSHSQSCRHKKSWLEVIKRSEWQQRERGWRKSSDLYKYRR